jgi:hypothetical protein
MPHHPDPATTTTRAAALRVLQRHGALDLAPMLGLTDSPPRRPARRRLPRRTAQDAHLALARVILTPK